MPQFDTPEPISVVLELQSADVRVSAAERADTTVEVRPGNPSNEQDVEAAEAIRVDYADATLVIKQPEQSRSHWNPFRMGGSVQVAIELPVGSSINAATASGDVSCTGALGRCEFKSASGDISVERATGGLDVSTASGDLRAGVVEGSVDTKSASGDTRIRMVDGDLSAASASGDVEVERVRGSVTVRTASGDCQVGSVERGSLLAQSASGDIEIAVAAGVAAWLDLSTGSGDVMNHLDDAESPGEAEDKVEIRARSGSGDITIRRAAPVNAA